MVALLLVILAALPLRAQPGLAQAGLAQAGLAQSGLAQAGLAQAGLAQPACPSAPTWAVCDLVFDLTAQENPERAELRDEFRSPRHHTYLLRAFREGERRLVIRFTPTEAGAWEYRLTSNLARLDGQMGQGMAGESDSPGFVHAANVHHFATENQKPHLWMSTGV